MDNEADGTKAPALGWQREERTRKGGQNNEQSGGEVNRGWKGEKNREMWRYNGLTVMEDMKQEVDRLWYHAAAVVHVLYGPRVIIITGEVNEPHCLWSRVPVCVNGTLHWVQHSLWITLPRIYIHSSHTLFTSEINMLASPDLLGIITKDNWLSAGTV